MYSMADLYDSDYKKAVILELDGNVVASGRVKFEQVYAGRVMLFNETINKFELDNLGDIFSLVGTNIHVASLPSIFSIRFEYNGDFIKLEKVVFNGDVNISLESSKSNMECTFEILWEFD